jgi:hypothetical protein
MGGEEGNALRRSVAREKFRAHEYTREVACGLGLSGVLVPTCNATKDNVWLRGGRLPLELFALGKVLLSRKAGLPDARGLYAEGSGGVEEVLMPMTTEVPTSQQRPFKLIKQRFSTFSGSNSKPRIMIYVYLMRCRLEGFLSATRFSSAVQLLEAEVEKISALGTVGTERQIALTFNCRTWK